MTPIVCAQCGVEGSHASHGLCRACYGYWHRTGRPRPPDPVGPQRCVACDRLLTTDARHAHRACHACAMLWWNWHRGKTRQPWYPARIAAVQAVVAAKQEAR